MSELFKEVTSPNNAAKAGSDKREDSAVAQTASAEKQPEKKGKHGDPGVCCGGCS